MIEIVAPQLRVGARKAAALHAFKAAVLDAARQAKAGLKPARLGFGLWMSGVNVNRNVETPHGWWLGANDVGYSDHTLGVLCIGGPDGRPLAVLMKAKLWPLDRRPIEDDET